MSYLTIFLFFVYCYGLGFTATSFVEKHENFLERNLMRIGIGLSLITFLGLLLNLLRIPIDWKIILIASIIYPIFYFIKNYYKFDLSNIKLKITKTDLSIIIMLLIFLATFYIYGTGAFKNPYLEDDDSWSHAIAVKYVSLEKTVYQGNAGFHYMDPYPPAYDMLFGILHQTNNSVYWTLKFFNALIISLSIIYFYFFVKELTGNRNKALFSTFALAAVPAYLSHFIWALALTVPLYFVSFYCVERVKYDKKWAFVAAPVIATTLASSPTHSTYFGLFFILYLLTKIILEKKFLIYHALAGILGLGFSFILWWLPMISKYGFTGTLRGLGLRSGGGESIISVTGTADRVYTISDFVWAKTTNMINSPIGIGLVLSLLLIISIIAIIINYKNLLKKENHWIVISLVLLLFTFYAVNAAKMPVKISPFRAWMLFVIPLSILVSEGMWFLMNYGKKIGIGKIITLSIVIIGILFTSAYQKYTLNTAQWPPGAFWTSFEEINGYVWLKENLLANTKVFTFVNDGPIIGMDKFTCYWCDDIKNFKKTGVNKSVADINSFLKSKGYEYLVIGGQFVRKYGVNETNNKLKDIASSGLFKPVHQTNGFFLFELL